MSTQRKDVVTHVLLAHATYDGYSFMYPKGGAIVVKSRVDDYKNKKSVYNAQFNDPRSNTTHEIQFDTLSLKNLDWNESGGNHNISLNIESITVEIPANPEF